MLKIKDFGFSEKQFTSNSIERHIFHLFFLGTSSNFPQTNLVSDFLLLLLFSSPVQEVIWSDFYIAIYLKYMKPIISRTYYSSVKIYSKNGQYYSLHIFVQMMMQYVVILFLQLSLISDFQDLFMYYLQLTIS